MINYINRDFAIELCRPIKEEEEGLPLRILKNIPLERVVTRDAFDQILWERDVMEEQLHSIGKGLGEKMDNIKKIKYGKNIADYSSMFQCSECSWECYDMHECDSDFNFCPNCGAIMTNGEI